jgi:phosphatidylglycerol---prolipoprotein diacylglyceryl transferase
MVLLSLLAHTLTHVTPGFANPVMPPILGLFTSPGPVLLHFGPITVRWYGLLIASAVLLGVILSRSLARRRQVDPEIISDAVIWLVLGAIPCARIYYVLFEWQQYANNPSRILAIWQGGIAIHGAIIGGVLAGLIFARVKRISFWQLADLTVPSLSLGQAIGRWGNFFNSEAFGSPTDLPWKLYIPKQLTINGQTFSPRPSQFANVDFFHPTFLYESIWNLGVLGLLLWLFSQSQKPTSGIKVGTLPLVYCIAYSLGRVWIEGLRMDSLMVGPLKMAQVISLVGVGIGAIGLFWLYGTKRRLPDVIAES